MKPVAIFRHAENEGPGYFATFLDAHRIPWQLIAIDRSERVPARAADYAGFCLMGACQDCWVRLADGRRVRACSTLLEDGQAISRDPGRQP